MFLGAVYKVTGGSILAARLAQSVLGVVSVLLIWCIAKRLFGRGPAFAAAAIAAIYPPLIFATEALMSESIFIPLMLGAVLCALIAREDDTSCNRWALACGALIGLGLLTRPNSLAMLPALLLLVAAWKRQGGPARPALVRAGLVFAAVVVVVLPWEIRNVAVMHSLVPISDVDGYNFGAVYNADAASSPYPARYQFRPPNAVATLAPLFSDPSLDEVSLGTKLRTAGLDWIKSHPLAPVESEAWNSLRMLELVGLDNSTTAMHEYGYGRGTAALGIVSFWVLLPLALLGLLLAAARRAPLALWLAPVCLWIGSALFLGDARLRSPVDVFLILAAGCFVAQLVVRFVDRAHQPTPRGDHPTTTTVA
jgi:4-amino-4-deoxy-L-arabinose transferase-like glycosyltransferase